MLLSYPTELAVIQEANVSGQSDKYIYLSLPSCMVLSLCMELQVSSCIAHAVQHVDMLFQMVLTLGYAYLHNLLQRQENLQQ